MIRLGPPPPPARDPSGAATRDARRLTSTGVACRSLVAALLACTLATTLGAQEPTTPPTPAPPSDGARGDSLTQDGLTRDSTRALASCDGRLVTGIDVTTRRPNFRGRAASTWRRLARSVGLHHSTTREDVVRRFLVIDAARSCNSLRVTESERILRAQPFLASASVRAVADGRNGARILVETTDELPAQVGLAYRRGQVSRLVLGNTNLGGFGIAARTDWQEGFHYRDGWAARVIDYQLLGKPYILVADARRRPLGGQLGFQLTHPYFTDLQRVAWRATYGDRRDYVRFLRTTDDPLGAPTLSVQRTFADIGGVVRIGQPGRLSLFGASISADHERTDAQPIIITDTGVVTDTTTALLGRYGGFRAARVNALWGVRNISFFPARGFDALTGVQDVRRGFRFGAQLGRSIPALGTADDDIFVAGDLFAGAGTARSYVGVELVAEGRQGGDRARWDGVLGSGRLAWYNVLTPRHTVILSSEFGGGWRQRVPFQLTLAERSGGVRGYRDSRIAGAQRSVSRFEGRWTLGRLRTWADVGVGGFADAGRMWAGDAPFGQTTETKYAAGVSLLAAVPPRSKRLYRLDVAMPINPDGKRKVEFRITAADLTRDFLREPGDVERGRERTVSTSVFDWP